MTPKYAAPTFIAFLDDLLAYHRDNDRRLDPWLRATMASYACGIECVKHLTEITRLPVDHPLPPSFVIPDTPAEPGPQPKWEADRRIHLRAPTVVPEINRWLNQVESEGWSRHSADAVAVLETPGLDVLDGIRVTSRWLERGATLLRAIDCALDVFPIGRPFQVFRPEADPVDTTLAWLIQHFDEQPALRELKTNEVIRRTHVNRTAGLRALRVLAERGVYRGHSRPPATRIADRRSPGPPRVPLSVPGSRNQGTFASLCRFFTLGPSQSIYASGRRAEAGPSLARSGGSLRAARLANSEERSP